MGLRRNTPVKSSGLTVAFPARLKEMREARGMTRGELAHHIGVAPGTIWNWENSHSIPKPESVAQLASILGVTKQFLQTGQGYGDAALDAKAANINAAEQFSLMIEDFRRKVAFKMGMSPSRIRVSVEFLSN